MLNSLGSVATDYAEGKRGKLHTCPPAGREIVLQQNVGKGLTLEFSHRVSGASAVGIVNQFLRQAEIGKEIIRPCAAVKNVDELL